MKNRQSVGLLSELGLFSRKAAGVGEPYIFKCGCMIKCSAPILFEEKLIGNISCGPVLLWDADDLSLEELENWAIKMEINEKNMQKFLEDVKQLSCESMTSAAEMLSFIVDYMCREESKFLAQRLRKSQ